MKKREPPVSVRFSKKERARLRVLKGDLSENAYIRHQALNPAHPPPRPKRRTVVADFREVAQIKALISQSRLPNNVNQIAKSLHVTPGVLTPDELAQVRELVDLLSLINAKLDLALGQRLEP